MSSSSETPSPGIREEVRSSPPVAVAAEAKTGNFDPRTPEAIAQELVSLLREEGTVNEQQERHALRVQARLSSRQTLLTVLQQLGFVNREQIRRCIQDNNLHLPLGDLLTILGHLRETDLKQALKLQSETRPRKPLGEVLIEQRMVEERTLNEILSLQLGYPYVHPELNDASLSLLSRGQLKWCRRHAIFPIFKEGERALVAFADPHSKDCVEAAEKVFGRQILRAFASRREIAHALDTYERLYLQTARAELEESPAVAELKAIMESALADAVSDIHLEPMEDRLRVRFRRDGVLVHHRDLPKDLALPLCSRLKVLAGADIAERRRHQDGKIQWEDAKSGDTIDMRVSFYITVKGEKVVLRLLNKKATLLRLEELGLGPNLQDQLRFDVLDVPTGVVIVTGPTGSGKTTTLYAALNYLNNSETAIVTVEDPVEYVIDGIAQCSINQKINVTFEETLRHIVRQDPDVIVLGEIRDQFSAETAIQAALTGHKVLTTFHTEDSIGGLVRLLNMNIEAFLISSTVVSVLAQRLLRRVCPHCAVPYQPTPVDLRRLGCSGEELRGAEFRAGRGCTSCNLTGYRGRIGVFELLILNEVIRDAIVKQRSSYEIRSLGLEKSGLVTLLEDGLTKAARGLTTLQEVAENLPRIGRPRPLFELRRLLGE